MGKMPAEGCFGEQEWVSGHVTDRCPVMFQTEYDILFHHYIWAKRGFLPYADRGWFDHPVGIITGLDIMFNAAAEDEIRRSKEAAKRQQ